ncbi:MAG: alanine racemase [Pseudomonadota bacterium]
MGGNEDTLTDADGEGNKRSRGAEMLNPQGLLPHDSLPPAAIQKPHHKTGELTWVEVSKSALENNIRQFRKSIGSSTILCPCVKANAYGHGLVGTAKIFLSSGADWLSVSAIYEARALRKAGITAPLYILGYVPGDAIQEAVALDCRLAVYNYETVKAVGEIAAQSGRTARVHIKVETGSNRQGICPAELIPFARYIKSFKNIELEGLSTHFANIEDTTDHSFAQLQIARFEKAAGDLAAAGIDIPVKHCANSAATILFPKTRFHLVRVGISVYGMWPSNETYVSYLHGQHNNFKLIPAFTWKTKIAQTKTVSAGEYIGYGCTYKTSHPTRLAIVPVGYYDGYDRSISCGYVLIHGKRASIRGRICMNILMVEITDIPEAAIEDEVVLIGRSDDEGISAEQFAQWAGTINYEVTTRVNDRIPRLMVE